MQQDWLLSSSLRPNEHVLNGITVHRQVHVKQMEQSGHHSQPFRVDMWTRLSVLNTGRRLTKCMFLSTEVI